jgi:hypothetical protein
MEGALNDILVQGVGGASGYIYLQHQKFTPELERVDVPFIKGITAEQYVDYLGRPTQARRTSQLTGQGDKTFGLHLYAMSTFMDDSYFDRSGWVFAENWPGFQFINQASKSGQILVFDAKRTYAIKAFTERARRSPQFRDIGKGYLLRADANTNEPVLRPEHRDMDKMGPGFLPAQEALWQTNVPIRVRAMVKAGDYLYLAGPPDTLTPEDPYASFDGRLGAKLWVMDAATGAKVGEHDLPAPPVFDGLMAADGKAFASLSDGSVVCLGGGE